MYISSHATNEREEESFCVVVSHVFSFYFIPSEKKNKRFRPRPFRLKKDKIFSFSCRQSFCFVVLPSHQFIEENEHDDDDDDDVFARCCRCVPPTNAHQEFCPDEGSACCSRCSQKKSAVERNWSRRAI
jgi:hypothetical protein